MTSAKNSNKEMQKFIKTGKIDDYLNYVKTKKRQEVELSKDLTSGDKYDCKGRNHRKDN